MDLLGCSGWGNLQLILFGGKGGVGKTTLAAAVALNLAHQLGNKKVLVVSTDPAHSLGHSFGYPVGDCATPIKGADNLWARELDASKLADDFKNTYRNIIGRLAERGTYFDQEDIGQFFSLSLPGVDELMAIMEIANLLKENEYDLIIVDTAPTGHTVRLLSLPDQMQKWLRILDVMQEKHRYLFKRFTGKYVRDDADIFLETMAKDIERVKALLTNDQTAEFVPVTTPEGMVIRETEKLLNILKNHRIPVKNIVVNRVAGEGDCSFCRFRVKGQIDHLREIGKSFGNYNLMKAPLFPREICGIDDLMEFAKALERGTISNNQQQSAYKLSAFKELPKKTAFMSVQRNRPKSIFGESIDNPRFLIFGGKGGVGKTTMAATTALYTARKFPQKRVLIFSTDPAHSLADSFDVEIGDKITPIEFKQEEKSAIRMPQSAISCGSTNLFAVEINANELFEGFKEEYKKEIDRLFDGFLSRGVSIQFDRKVMRELISLSPPGLDELMALKEIIDVKERQKFDLFILDTSPTGHLIRFLELPEIATTWLHGFFRLLMKYRNMADFSAIARVALELSRNVREVREALTDSQRCEFIAVTTAESMSLMETVRLLSDLKRLKIPCNSIIMNMVMPDTSCGFCASKGNEQRKYIREINRDFPEYTVSHLPLFPEEINGMDRLREISGILYGGESSKRRYPTPSHTFLPRHDSRCVE